MSNATDKQDIKKENQELLERMKSLIEKGKRVVGSNMHLLGGPRKTLARRVGVLHAFTGKEWHQLRRTSVKHATKDLLAIAALGGIHERAAVIDALSDPDNRASSLQEAKYRAGLDRREIERIERDRAESMDRDWASANLRTLEHFVKLVAGWDHKLASALLGAARVAIKSWEEL